MSGTETKELLNFHVITNERGQAMLIADFPLPTPKTELVIRPFGPEDPESWLVLRDDKPWATVPGAGALAMVGAAEIYFGYIIGSAENPRLSEGKKIQVRIVP